MGRKSVFKELQEQTLQSPYMMLLVGASVLLSVASFYTTWVGIIPFIRYDVFAAFITVGIQALLFVEAWRLGFMFADKEPVSYVEMAIFAICLALSVFFSFNSLFNVIFGEQRQQEASLGRVRDGSTEAVNQVEQILLRQRDEQIDTLRKSDAYRDWRRNLLAIADLAQSQGERLHAMFRRQRGERQAAAAEAERAEREIKARKGTIEDEIATMERELAELEETLPELRETLPGLRASLRELEDQAIAKEAELSAEVDGIGDTGRAGFGPVAQGLKKELDTIQAQRQLTERQLDTARARVREREDKVTDLRETLRKTRLLFRNIDAEIAAAEAEAHAARTRASAFGNQGDLESSVERLREYPVRFETDGDLTELDNAETLCNQFYDNLRSLPKPPSELDRYSCDRGPMMGMVAPLRATLAAVSALRESCTGKTAPSFHEMSFQGSLDRAKECIELTGLPYKQVRRQREELSRLQREEGPNASEFTKTTNALLAGEKLAFLALLIALAIDLLVLFAGLVGAKSTSVQVSRNLPILPDDTEEIVAFKLLLNNASEYAGKHDGVRFVGAVDLDHIDDGYRDKIETLLRRNASKGLTRQDKKVPTRYLLRHGAEEEFEKELRKLEEDLAVTSSPAPASGQAAGGALGQSGYGQGRYQTYRPGQRHGRFRASAEQRKARPARGGTADPAASPSRGSGTGSDGNGGARSGDGLEGAESTARPGIGSAQRRGTEAETTGAGDPAGAESDRGGSAGASSSPPGTGTQLGESIGLAPGVIDEIFVGLPGDQGSGGDSAAAPRAPSDASRIPDREGDVETAPESLIDLDDGDRLDPAPADTDDATAAADDADVDLDQTREAYRRLLEE